MSNLPVKLDPQLLKRARQASGTSSSGNKLSYVKINYTDDKFTHGNFIAKKWDAETETFIDSDLGDKFNGVILAHTKKCGKWNQQEQKSVYESDEFDSYNELVTLYNADGQKVDTSIYTELKARYDLKIQLVLYLYLEGLGYFKMFVSGTALFPFGDYEKEIINAGSALQANQTVFGRTKDRNGSSVYYIQNFTLGEPVKDFAKMVEASEKVRETINKAKMKTQVESQEALESPKATQVAEAMDGEVLSDLPF